MPRIPNRVLPAVQPSSPEGPRLTAREVSGTTPTEATVVARQGADLLADGQAVSALGARLNGERVGVPLSSLGDLPAGRLWLDGSLRLDRASRPEEVKVLQRALMKVGAHHPRGAEYPELLQMPYGADGSLGDGTLRAVDAALRLAGREDLVPSSGRLPLGAEVAQALEGLLRDTPVIERAAPPPAAPGSGPVPQRLHLLGGIAIPIGTTPYAARWNSALARMDQERSNYRPDAPGLSPGARYWVDQLGELKGKPEQYQVNVVNRVVNEFVYESDGPRDTWSSPLEFFANRGDCEDYAIAKYASLRELGFDESRMRLLVVHDPEARQGHAVLAVDMPDGTYILDNQSQMPLKHEDVRNIDGRPRYEPRVALARGKQWVYGRPAP